MKNSIKYILRKIVFLLVILVKFKISLELTNLFFIEEIKNYKKIVADYADMLDELNIDEPFDIYNAYTQSLYSGYLSCNKEYQIDDERIIFFDYYGLSCIDGKGVCLNQADMLTDIIREKGYNAYTILCYVDWENDSKINPYDNFFKIVSNHAVTVVDTNNGLYFLDPTLETIYVKNGDKLMSLDGNESISLKKFLTSFLLKDLFFKVDFNKDTYDIDYEAEFLIEADNLEQFYKLNQARYSIIHNQLKNKNPYTYLLCIASSFIIGFQFIIDTLMDIYIEEEKIKKLQNKKA